MSELNQEILEYLAKADKKTLDTFEYARVNNLDHQKVVGAVKSLQTHEGVNKPDFTSVHLFYIYLIDLNRFCKVAERRSKVFQAIPAERRSQSYSGTW